MISQEIQKIFMKHPAPEFILLYQICQVQSKMTNDSGF